MYNCEAVVSFFCCVLGRLECELMLVLGNFGEIERMNSIEQGHQTMPFVAHGPVNIGIATDGDTEIQWLK